MDTVTLEEGTNEMFGNLVQFAGDTKLETTAKTFVVAYRIHNGRFEISEFKEKNPRADADKLKAEAQPQKNAAAKMKIDKQAEIETFTGK